MKPKHKTYTVYFASELFSHKHLIGNAYLAEAIYDRSHGRYRCILPQNLQPARASPRAIRDLDLRTLLSCDLGLFSFDGPELDAGTVIEYMLAKFADLPAVLVRSDFRRGGDQDGDPWNLMASFYPRTVQVVMDSLGHYRVAGQKRRHTTPGRPAPEEAIKLAGHHSSADAQALCEDLAAACVRALDRVAQLPPVMPKEARAAIYDWLSVLIATPQGLPGLRAHLETALKTKMERELL